MLKLNDSFCCFTKSAVEILPHILFFSCKISFDLFVFYHFVFYSFFSYIDFLILLICLSVFFCSSLSIFRTVILNYFSGKSYIFITLGLVSRSLLLPWWIHASLFFMIPIVLHRHLCFWRSSTLFQTLWTDFVKERCLSMGRGKMEHVVTSDLVVQGDNFGNVLQLWVWWAIMTHWLRLLGLRLLGPTTSIA